MRVLIVGGGGASGAWAMRGEQLGAAIGARVTADPTEGDLDWATVVVRVKRWPRRLRPWEASLRASRKPVVWDAVDFWHQPDRNGLDEQQAIGHFRDTITAIAPAGVIAATERMAADCGGFYIPHHARIGLTATPVRETVGVVAYEGSERYLTGWRETIETECTRRGWLFVVNPTALTDADIIVAFRGDPWGGWMSTHWKSGVKYANSLAAGRPIITEMCAAFQEMSPIGTTIESTQHIGLAFDGWAPYAHRQLASIVAAKKAEAYALPAIAAQYRACLSTFS